MDGSILYVHLTPRAARNELVRYEAGVLHIRVTAPPIDGAANRALVAYLAERLDVRRGAVSILSGAASRDKKVRIEGIDDSALRARLEKLGENRHK